MNQPLLYHFHWRLAALSDYHRLILTELTPVSCRYGCFDEWLLLSGALLPGVEALAVSPRDVVILEGEEIYDGTGDSE